MIAEDNLTEIFAQAWFYGRVNWIHLQMFRAASLNRSLNLEDEMLLNRLLYAVRRGWLKVGG